MSTDKAIHVNVLGVNIDSFKKYHVNNGNVSHDMENAKNLGPHRLSIS